MNRGILIMAGLALMLPLPAGAQEAAQKPEAQQQAQVQANVPPIPKRHPAPENARAYIIWPYDGAVVPGGKLWVRMGLQNFGVAPSGIDHDHTGHHHLIVDADLPPLDEPIPNNRHYLHFGAGQTEARLELPPGRHTLQMLVGDADHIPHDPPVMSPRITITVPE